MAKYLSYGGLEKVWGLAKNYFPTVKTATADGTEVTWTTNTGVSAGNVATFAVDANGLVSLQGITTSSLASSHTHDISITQAGSSGTTLSAGTWYTLTAGGKSVVFKTPANPSIGNGTFQVVANSGTSGIATPFTANGSNAIALNFINGNNTTAVVTAVSNKAPTITFNHNAGSAASVTDGTAGDYAKDTEYTVLTGISYTVDSYGHITGISTTRQKIKDTNTTYTRNVSRTSANVTAGTIPVWSAAATGSSAAASLKDGYTVDSTTLSSSSTAIPTSKAVSDAISGLSGAMHFCGTTTTALTDGATTATLEGTGLNKTTGFVAGDVVIYSNKEFVWTGSAWELLGDEGSYALKTVTITGTGELGGGGAISSNQTITHNTSGATAGTYGPTQTAAVSGSNNTKINVPKITVNEYGHVTSIENIEYTSVDHTYNVYDKALKLTDGTNTKTAVTGNSSADRTVTFSGDSWITPTVGGSDSAATVSFAHVGPGTGSDITATQSSTQLTANTSYVVTGVQADGKGHITGITTAKLPADTHTGKAVYSTAATGKGSGLYVGTSNTATTTSSTSTNAAYIRLHLVNDGTLNSSAANSAVSAVTSGKYYPVELDKNGCLAVSVPWENSTYTVNNGTMQISANSSSAVNTLFTANGSTANAIKFVNGTGNTVTVTAASGTTTPATVTINNDHEKTSPTAVTAYPSGTTASANGGTIKVRDIQFNANGHVTASQERTITLSQVDTKNTAGSSAAAASTTYYIIGAASQGANPQTYSSSSVYFKDGVLYSNGTQVMVSGDMEAITDAEINTVCVI